MSTITTDDIWNEVVRVAREKPDFAYQKPQGERYCLYVQNGGPGCIVGHALLRLGVPVETLEAAEGVEVGSLLVTLHQGNVVEHTDSRAADMLYHVQSLQDDGTPWGEAVTKTMQAYEPAHV